MGFLSVRIFSCLLRLCALAHADEIPVSTVILTLPLSFFPAHIAEYGSLKPKRRDGGGDLATRLHLSKASRADPHGDQQHHQGSGGNNNSSADGQWNRIDDEVKYRLLHRMLES